MTEITKYLITGIATTIVSFVSFFGMTFFIGTDQTVTLQICNAFSFICAVLFSYVLSRLWVFQSKDSITKEFIRYLTGRIGVFCLDALLMQVLVFHCQATDFVAKCITQIIVTIANYLISKLLIFKKKGVVKNG